MLSRSRRVTSRLVKEIVSQSRPFHGRFLYMRGIKVPENKDFSAFSVIVPKSIEKTSVGRHKLRRKIGEALRPAMKEAPTGAAIVIFAKETAKKALRSEIIEDGLALLDKIRV